MTQGITVLGIDPGSRVTGWGVVREISGVASLVDCGTVRTADADIAKRLGIIFRGVSDVITTLRPDVVAVENVFTAKNAASALKLGQARGAAIAACALHGLDVHSYEPTKVKQAIVGTGRADKQQVAFMVATILGVKKPSWAVDASDALGVALCHLTLRRYEKLAAR
ncbi:crossover junction endodeoxyribonuclease RuvC [Desulfovibrio subterraneus]|jgi:crossover junction endodeoxyribonuclease RuvC|uniref:Crossover junction endodeoxyribonuclease RuvC n=1 Tax=Desulfovibrio subterraneus TaxID=2718620 RepID=A0A7J0BI64_9BACT|nr:crossover junction endodeoxyribonuclease RuvC [Desulfovibrio subterraneus]WBF67523.1 crossover junction endodeoxyribonuclease RuvC [Desulfovibrio subterraneus]GFM33356.1 crossover junction endodeoxyribonuclease RuvC [Desulfovibrio subterraneus]